MRGNRVGFADAEGASNGRDRGSLRTCAAERERRPLAGGMEVGCRIHHCFVETAGPFGGGVNRGIIKARIGSKSSGFAHGGWEEPAHSQAKIVKNIFHNYDMARYCPV